MYTKCYRCAHNVVIIGKKSFSRDPSHSHKYSKETYKINVKLNLSKAVVCLHSQIKSIFSTCKQLKHLIYHIGDKKMFHKCTGKCFSMESTNCTSNMPTFSISS